MSTFEQKMAQAIELAQIEADKKYELAIGDMLNNPEFIEVQRGITKKSAELDKLNAIITQLNSIAPFISKDGGKSRIHCYPVSFFGMGLAQVIGIIMASRNAFTDDLALQYTAITRISIVELTEAREALGSPAFMNDAGIVTPAVYGNIDKFIKLLKAILVKLDIREFNPERITADRINLWHAREELKIADRKESNRKTELLNTIQYTMED